METKDKNSIDHITGSKAQSIEHAHMKNNRQESADSKNLEMEVIIEIGEERWPEVKESVKEQFPDISDSDLPYKKQITDSYFGRIEQKYGHARNKVRNVVSAFHTWRV